MEISLLQNIFNGGPLAVTLFLLYMIYTVKTELKGINNHLSSIDEKLNELSIDKVSKEDHYRDTSGWRTELNRLEDKLDRAVLKGLINES